MPKPVVTFVSRSAVKKRVGWILLLALIAGAFAYPPATNAVIDFTNTSFGSHIPHLTKNFVLGLDLQGGTRLEYEADVSKISELERKGALDGARDVIERRVNSLGVSEPLVQTARVGDAWRVSVELAGIRDVNQAIKLIGETPILEFKEQNTETPRDLTAEETKTMNDANAAAKKRAEENLTKALKDPSVLTNDLGFIKDKPEYAELFEAVKSEPVGKVVPRVIDTTAAYVVAKVEEVKDAGVEISGNHILIQYIGATAAPTSTTRTKDEARQRIEEIRKEATAQNFVDLAKKYSEEPNAAETGGDLGWFGKGVMVPQFEEPAFALKVGEISGVVESPFGFHLIFKSGERPLRDVHVRALIEKKMTPADILPPQGEWKNTELTGKQLKRAQVDFDQRSGVAQVALTFDDEGTKLFAEITKRNIGKPVAIFLDGEPISEPTVQSVIPNGQAVITGNFSIADAKLLAQRLQAGALPVPIKLIAQQSVGPTLGQDSVNKSLTAGLWGFAFIAIFMLAWYRAPGFFALVSLLLYAGLSFMIFKLLPVTLTLSGIAGFILSLGIAVDANVLIFERLKEELKAGKTYALALEEAFKRAWPSIRDGNTTTLISCAVLYWFSSSVIKGFALTLAIGILVSLFTAIIVTRNVMRFVTGTSIVNKMPWLFLSKKQVAENR
jgi:protein-export membrane protein SecD